MKSNPQISILPVFLFFPPRFPYLYFILISHLIIQFIPHPTSILIHFFLIPSSYLFPTYYIFYLQNTPHVKMNRIGHRPNRPFSRLDNIHILQDIKQTLIKAAGIPEKSMSASKPFPIFELDLDDKQNSLLMAPKKQEKLKNRLPTLQTQQVFRRKCNSEISKLSQNIPIKFAQIKNKECSSVLADHLELSTGSCMPVSQNLRNGKSKQARNKSLVGEQKSVARRVRERIQAESLKNQEKKKRRSTLGQDAYLPFPIHELKQKIAERSRKSSYDQQKILIF